MTNEQWKALREELAKSLETLEGVSKAKVVPYLDQLEPKLIAIASMTPEQARQALDDLAVNARADLYILGIAAETESARLAVFGIRLAAGLLRAAAGMPAPSQ